MQSLHKELKKNIKFLSHHSASYHKKHHAETPMLKERDKIYLLQKNIKITRLSRKLDHVSTKSFKIVRNIKNTSSKLKLPKNMRIHSVFHISLLKKVSDNVSELKQVLDNYLIKQKN